MELNCEEDYNKYLNTLNYLVVYPDKETKFFKSLREIMKEIYVDSSTISKKLSENGDSCYVTCRMNDYIFYIKKMSFGN
jgi:hypothetical protein